MSIWAMFNTLWQRPQIIIPVMTQYIHAPPGLNEVDTMGSTQNDRRFADDIFKHIFMNENLS